jgi:Mce-associated membrane protein
VKGNIAGILAGVTVLFSFLAAWFAISALSVPGPSNSALVDGPGTSAVTDQVGRAIRTVFSYDPAQLDQTSAAAQQVLTGSAVTQYNSLFTQAKEHAVATHQVLTTAVRSIGVVELHGDSARLLVFVDRQLVRGDQHESAVAQLLVNATKTGDTWKIADIQLL